MNVSAIPAAYGKLGFKVNSQPAIAGPPMRPSESNEDKTPVALPWPSAVCFVNKAETHGRMTPLPMPKIVK